MRKIYFVMALLCSQLISQAQTDTTKTPQTGDTIRIGNLTIIKKGGTEYQSDDKSVNTRHKHHGNLSTNWGIVDIGFNNYTDKTDYTLAQSQGFVGAGVTKDKMKLKQRNSVNVNIWFFMQRLNVIKHVVNLKYGLGLELNNYRYDENIRYTKNPTKISLDTRDYKKNKLAADYVTVPLLLNFNFTPKNEHKKSFGVSAGVSGGFLYSSRQKTITAEDGKQKLRNDFDLRPFKLSYIGELQLGPVKLYGSLATQSMFEKGLDQTPYAVGIRLSNW